MLRRRPGIFAPTDGVAYVADEAGPPRGGDFADASLYSVRHRLDFRRMRVTARDVELAGATGCEVTAKLEVRAVPGLGPDAAVLCEGRVFDLTSVERRGPTDWLWLAEVATDGTCDLVDTAYEYDAVGIAHRVAMPPTTVHVRRVSQGLRRTTFAMDALGATMALRLRASDYQGEQQVRRNGVTYTVASAEGHGRWVDLACRERASDRG